MADSKALRAFGELLGGLAEALNAVKDLTIPLKEKEPELTALRQAMADVAEAVSSQVRAKRP